MVRYGSDHIRWVISTETTYGSLTRYIQIVEKDATTIKAELGNKNKSPATTLVEIGPRFVLTPIRIFEGSFGGPTVFSNPGKLVLSRVKFLLIHFRILTTNQTP